MPRAQFRDTVLLRTPNGTVLVPQSSSAAVYDVGTSSPITDTLYADNLSGTTLANPIAIGADGAIAFWTLLERELDVVVSTSGYAAVRITSLTKAALNTAATWQSP